ncbi:allantoinase AllB [Actinoallomurus rhizosphaericola]|uniref:allantoinase AllB n=1 Tax=Actinoallomurus rhizosphaericola TaxID=2952536 RepID=UPI002092C53B|nr:allantoinase AllB [Actinoallomurus rhizosphaericola]MCO5995325.1 allantoinase AllB [Actinoallomurus rhizosphaericola]
MREYDLVVRSRRTVLPDGERPAAVAVRDGRIAAVTGHDEAPPARSRADLGDVALLPGLVDTHVHVNEPGRTEWEGFATATRAAAAGGVTTIVDMPLNSLPPVTTAGALAVKRDAAAGRCFTDVGFWGGAVPGNTHELRALHDGGVFGFKCFTADSGVPEFPPLSYAEMEEAFAEVASFDGLVIVHAEDPGSLSAPLGGAYDDFLASRPPSAESKAVEQVIRLAETTGVRAHVLHLSAAGCAEPLARARAAGVRVTAETCPHYLTLTAADVRPGATHFKCCPPIRDAANRDGLWRALAAGVIDCVVSDHSPCPPELKRGGFDEAWGGISSLQLGLPAVWTEARRRGHDLTDVVCWMSAAPTALAGLPGKGAIAVGNDADLVAFAPDEVFTVDPAALRTRHRRTPYAGRELTGVVRTTWLRGEAVDGTPRGRLLGR